MDSLFAMIGSRHTYQESGEMSQGVEQAVVHDVPGSNVFEVAASSSFNNVIEMAASSSFNKGMLADELNQFSQMMHYSFLFQKT